MFNNKIYGYVKINAQDKDKQEQERLISLWGENQGENVIMYIDENTGKAGKNLPRMEELKKVAKKGDTIVITELNRLGRQWGTIRLIYEEFYLKGINIVILDLPRSTQSYGLTKANDTYRVTIGGTILDLIGYYIKKENMRLTNNLRRRAAFKEAKGVINTKKRITVPIELRERICTLSLSGVSQEKIAEIVGKSVYTVRKILKQQKGINRVLEETLSED